RTGIAALTLRLLHCRVLVDDCAQPECICTVRCPVVIGTEIDPALVVTLRMIPTQRLDPGVALVLVEPHPVEEPSCFLNPVERGSSSLVGNDRHFVVRS